jgi:SAM-dependent methyltransferase
MKPINKNQDFYEDDDGLKFLDPGFFTDGIKEYLEKEERFVLSLFPRYRSVLDIGCGTGRYLKLLSPHVDKIVGMDYSAKMVEISRRETSGLKSVAGIIECSAENLIEHVPGKFDAALLAWNTFGNMNKANHLEILKNIFQKVSKSVYISVYRAEDNVMKERLNYYKKLNFKVEKIHDNDVTLSVGGHSFLAIACTESYYKTILTEAGFTPYIHKISSCGMIVEGRVE